MTGYATNGAATGASKAPGRASEGETEAGFTLVELLVVLAIIALVATLVGPRVLGYVGAAKADTASVQVRNISSALELYFLDTGSYPDPVAGLSALVENRGAPNWNGPYLKNASGLADPWGRAYAYESTGVTYRVTSLGRDGQPGGEGEDADIASAN
ncbi:type II secretion system major pseudopilin GspG [Antarcticirhabdus aurantiaca]|uniref:Type II secretion system major pseudopilin GspG n=1 Tax=Antarcticirhabdus aurantiaca TaxID=2606717 RepID=A0ACD4NMA2_9HYPH|nr:type II secretion system major pseudopilin GspG [Antarcticirhabdus aurantiaca]WAJ27827.1 type II secretion system major pseudopilin GspG [Jeongeuplla avenae]